MPRLNSPVESGSVDTILHGGGRMDVEHAVPGRTDAGRDAGGRGNHLLVAATGYCADSEETKIGDSKNTRAGGDLVLQSSITLFCAIQSPE